MPRRNDKVTLVSSRGMIRTEMETTVYGLGLGCTVGATVWIIEQHDGDYVAV